MRENFRVSLVTSGRKLSCEMFQGVDGRCLIFSPVQPSVRETALQVA